MHPLGRCLLLVPMAALLNGTATVSASNPLALPYGSTAFQRSCGYDAMVAGDGCILAGSASAASGSVAATTRLVSPGEGVAPWTATAQNGSFIVAPYHLAVPSPRLDFTVTIHVSTASLTLRTLPWSTGSPYVDFLFGELLYPNINHWVSVDVSASALHAQCSTCSAGTAETVLHALVPTTMSASGLDYVLHMSMSNANGGPIPPGDITVRAGGDTASWQGDGPGDDAADIQAVVTSITLM
jgi:hypothetical protein